MDTLILMDTTQVEYRLKLNPNVMNIEYLHPVVIKRGLKLLSPGTLSSIKV